MNKLALILASALLSSALTASSDRLDRCDKLSKGQLQSVIEFLSSDALEGRAPGTRGGLLAENYMYDLFKLLGLEARFQPFRLQGFRLEDVEVAAAGSKLAYHRDVVGSYPRAESEFSLEGEAVFAGFGIRTPLWKWDDYKRSDLRGKILIVRVNDPGLYDPRIFEGGALTYFGRWTYKLEEAARAGALAVLLIHTTPTAGYDWQVVQNSWSGEELYLPDDLKNDLRFRGWVREESLRAVLAGRRIDLDGLYRRSLSRRFRPVDLGFRIRISGRNAFRELEARNVIGELPGSSGKSIVLSAHIDHFGRDERLAGDQIYNGAIDNGAAVAAMTLAAKMFADSDRELRHGLTFVACQCEEAGLLGSQYFVAHADRENIVANINFESTPVWEKSLDAFAEGARYSTLEELVRSVAAEQGLEYSQFSLSDQGLFFRADQFSFARAGIPALWISAGEKSASGRNHIAEFFKGGAYHTVKDEFDPRWELEALRQTVKLAVGLVEKLEQAPELPRWKARLTFPVSGGRGGLILPPAAAGG